MILRKSFIVLLLAVAGLVGSCGNGNNYSLSGSLPADYNGCCVLLSPAIFYFSSEKSIPVDSAEIRDGKFQFCGTVQEPAVFMLTVTGARDARIPGIASTPVIIERGDIKALYNTTGITFSGTPVNECYRKTIGQGQQELIRRREFLLRERDSVKQLSGRDVNDVDNYYNAQSRILYEETVVRAAEKFIHEYAGTPVGDYFFFSCCSKDTYRKEFVEAVYLMIRPETRRQYEALIRARQEKQNLFMNSQKSTAEGMSFREIVAQTPDGKEIRLSDYIGKGKLVLLDFWGSWCVPCIQEMPLLKELHEKYGNKGLVIIGVSLDKDRGKWQGALEKHKPIGIQVSDLNGWDSTSRNNYGVQAIPFVLLIDGTGKIIARNPHGPKLIEIVERYFHDKKGL